MYRKKGINWGLLCIERKVLMWFNEMSVHLVLFEYHVFLFVIIKIL